MEQVLISAPNCKPSLPPPRTLPKWRLHRVLSGHTGWVRALSVDPTNNSWISTGSNDKTIKIWDTATGQLKLTLTGHVSSVRGLCASPRHPYLFSCGEDRQTKCWDLESNTVVRHYHGHLHSVNAVRVHPALDIIGTASRDGTAKLWDMRTKACIHTLTGHRDAVNDIQLNDTKPQVMTASADSTIRLWDIVSGRTMSVLTHHKKGVRALALDPSEHTFGSAGERVKRWSLPQGRFLHNLQSDDIQVWNCLDINQEGVAVGGSDNGLVTFWDWRNGGPINQLLSPVQPGSLDCEAGILACKFDLTGLRLFTGCVDKTIKVYKEDI
jgi:pleiotropic regulator 1